MLSETKTVTLRDKKDDSTHQVPVLKEKWDDASWRGEWMGWLAKNQLEYVPDET